MEELKPMELLKNEAPQLEALMNINAREGVDVKTLVLQELEYVRIVAMQNPAILQCMPQTVLIAVKTVMKQNLTMDPAAGLVYVKTRNVKVGQTWSKALEIIPSANGLISINRQCGRILDIKNPVVKKDEQGKVVGVHVEILLPSVPSPRWETRSFDESDFWRWRRASHKENGRNKETANAETMNFANDNYTNFKGGIDPEFARAKAIRHGLKKLGVNLNEGHMDSINISTNKVVIDSEKDQAATGDSPTYAEVIEETPKSEEAKPAESAIQPSNDFNVGPGGL